MKYIAWGVLTVVTGLIFWLALIFVVSFLQLNGVLLNDTIQIEATFKDFTWVEFVAAFGTFGAAVAAAISAFAANKSSKLSEATLLEMKQQRKSTEKIAEAHRKSSEAIAANQELADRKRLDGLAGADRAMISFALSGLCNFFSLAAGLYGRLWAVSGNEHGTADATPETLERAFIARLELPYRELELMRAALATNPEKHEEISQILSAVQIVLGRHNALQKDVSEHCGVSIGCFSEVLEIAEAYAKTAALFNWARFEPEDIVQLPDPIGNALHNMRLEYKFTSDFFAWRETGLKEDVVELEEA